MKQFSLYVILSILLLNFCHAVEKMADGFKNAKMSHDFGEVTSMPFIFEHDFILKNDSSSEVQVKDAQSTCGCTTTDISRSIIPPGSDLKVSIRMDLNGVIGEKKASVAIQFTDGSTILLSVKGSSPGSISSIPDGIRFAAISGVDESVSKSLEIRVPILGANRDAAQKVTRVEITSPGITWKQNGVPKTNHSHKVYVYLFEISGDVNAMKTSTGKFQITFDDQSHFTVPIETVIRPAVMISPSLVQFGRVSPNSTSSKTLKVDSVIPFKFTDVKSDNLKMQAKLDNGGGNNQAAIDLLVSWPAKSGPSIQKCRITLIGDKEYVVDLSALGFVD